VLILGSGHSSHAGETPGLERKVLAEVDSAIPAYAKIRIREVTFQPGASVAVQTMDNDMICQCTAGSLQITNDGRTFAANTGQAWTCHRGDGRRGEYRAKPCHQAYYRPAPRLASPHAPESPARAPSTARLSEAHEARESLRFKLHQKCRRPSLALGHFGWGDEVYHDQDRYQATSTGDMGFSS
jgi:quercetin dioxygenase-like cupin family protein